MKTVVALTLTALAVSFTLTSASFAEERKVKVEFDAPATNYRVKIQEVHRVGDQLWVISKVSTAGDFGGSAITRVSDEIEIDAPEELPVIHKVLGKTWNWGKDTKNLQYVAKRAELDKALKEEMAERIWQRPKD